MAVNPLTAVCWHGWQLHTFDANSRFETGGATENADFLSVSLSSWVGFSSRLFFPMRESTVNADGFCMSRSAMLSAAFEIRVLLAGSPIDPLYMSRKLNEAFAICHAIAYYLFYTGHAQNKFSLVIPRVHLFIKVISMPFHLTQIVTAGYCSVCGHNITISSWRKLFSHKRLSHSNKLKKKRVPIRRVWQFFFQISFIDLPND